MISDDDDPIWKLHTGGSGHEGPEWKDGDQERARIFYDSVADVTRRVLDLLMDRPGELVDAKEIYQDLRGREWCEGDPNWRKSVAASLNSVRLPSRESGRRLPFYWWEPTGDADTRYAVKTTVAQIFRAATRGKGQK
jgi:hypothetical protein